MFLIELNFFLFFVMAKELQSLLQKLNSRVVVRHLAQQLNVPNSKENGCGDKGDSNNNLRPGGRTL
jgi:hypothetical protein